MTFSLMHVIFAFVFIPLASSRRCCYPQQFEARIDTGRLMCDADQQYSISTTRTYTYADFGNQRMRIDEFLNNGTTTILSFISSNTKYTIVDGVCTMNNSPIPMQRKVCVPENATLTEKYRLGYKPGVKAHVYSWHLRDAAVNVTETFSDSCFPIARRIYSGTILIGDIQIKDFLPRIRRRTVFDIPKNCPNSDVKGHPMFLTEDLLIGVF